MPPPFFDSADLQHLYDWSEDENLAYDKNNEIHREAGERIKVRLWNPTEYWAQEVCGRLEGFWSDGRKLWHQQAGFERFRFRHYTWYRLFPSGDYHDEVYFTVGVDAESGLLMKIDFQRRSSKILTDAQYEYCEENFIQEEGTAYWTSIPGDLWVEYDWDRLITETVAFVSEHLPKYRQHIDKLNELNAETRLARICWNSLGWRQPSGRNGKSTSKKSHEGKYGFGNEEWLFSDLYQHDGWCYSRFDPLASDYDTYVGKKFNLRLYTSNGEERQQYWVALLRNAEVISPEESTAMARIFKKQVAVAVGQLMALPGVHYKILRDWPASNLFNIRFKLDQIIHFGDELRPFEDGESVSSPRYVLLNEREWTRPSPNVPSLEPLLPFGPGQLPGGTDPKKRTRSYSSGIREYDALHDPLKNAFAHWLKLQHHDHTVTVENRSSFYGRADVIRQNGDQYHLYEVKTYSNAFIAIRVALGQLLTYSYASGTNLASSVESITIVCQSPPDDEGLAEKIIVYLNKVLKIPISYIQFEVGANSPKCVLTTLEQ